MRSLTTSCLVLFTLGCTENGIVRPPGECPPGQVWIDGECVVECNPPCGPGETCDHETGTCVEARTGDGTVDGDAPVDPAADPAGDGPAGDLADVPVDPGADGMDDPPVDSADDASTDGSPGDVTGDEGDAPCLEPNVMCGSECVDLMTDTSHCGACDSACPARTSCVMGVCQCAVPGEMMCDGACIDVMTDPLNCGGCDVRCDESGPRCEAGACMCGPDPACAPCDVLSCDTCETCCPFEGCMAMNVSNCGSCGLDCSPLDQCGAYVVSGACSFVCEEAFDPSMDYDGLFDITPYASTACSGRPSHDIRQLLFMVMGGDLTVRGNPYVLVQSPVSTTADFSVTGSSGCMTVTLTGHFRNADVFEGTWVSTVTTYCPGCVGETILITGMRR